MVSDIDGVKRVLVDTSSSLLDRDVGSVHPGTPDLDHPIPVRTLGATKGTLSASSDGDPSGPR